MYDTHSPSEWAAVLSLAASAYAACCVPYFLLVDADAADFDPRPAVRRALETGRLVPVWQAAVDTGHDLNRAIATGQRGARDAATRARRAPLHAALTVAALLSLLIPATPEASR